MTRISADPRAIPRGIVDADEELSRVGVLPSFQLHRLTYCAKRGACNQRLIDGTMDNLDILLKLKGERRIVVVMPAYNAARTLEMTFRDIPHKLVDEIILVDDASKDDTWELAKRLGIAAVRHPRNRGYGGNQKTCYSEALRRGADIAVMVHPDYQYNPTVIPHLVEPLLRGEADAVFGSRMLGGKFLEGGMPLWKFYGNVMLTAIENIAMHMFLTECHSGFRAYSRRYLQSVNFLANSDDFVFDTEIIAQGIYHGLRIREIPIETRYFDAASQISFRRSVVYGLSILLVMLKFRLQKAGLVRLKMFSR
jgi:glycosyltransferase involved in cell wall biosynthesis